jgi:orotidine-5'-phosphate decarboxylase
MSKIIVAIDNMSMMDYHKLSDFIQDHVWGFKLRSLALNYISPEFRLNNNLMLDMKFYDLPSSIMEALTHALGAGYNINTVHLTANFEGNEELNKFIAGVSVLTSYSEEEWVLYHRYSIRESIKQMHDKALEYGYGYFVCSAQDLEFLDLSNSIKYICPGIRYKSSNVHDQKRVVSPIEAVQLGADYLVIGRMITHANDPLEVIKQINQDCDKIF